MAGNLFRMKLSKPAFKRLLLLALAIACLVPAMPAAVASEPPTRARSSSTRWKSPGSASTC